MEAGEAPFFHRDTVSKLGYQFKLGMASFIGGAPGFWILEILMIFATYISTSAVAATAIIRTFNALIQTVSAGQGSAAGFFVGKAIGEMDEMTVK